MNFKFFVVTLLLSFSFYTLAEADSQLLDISIDSKITKQSLSFKLSLPNGYENAPDKFYPVFITTAGGSRIESLTSQVKWLSHVDFAPIPQVILLTIPDIKYANKDKFTSAAGQESATLAQVLRDEVLPHIDNTYRTSGYRIIEGFSSFGHFPLYMLRHHSDVINAFFIFSPALGLDKSGLVASLDDNWQLSSKRHHYLYLSLGTFLENRQHFEQAKASLNKLAKTPRTQFEFADLSKDNYLSGPTIGLIKASQSTFADLQPDYTIFHDEGEVALTRYFKKLNEKYGEEIDLKNKLVDLSFSYANSDKFDQAIALMKSVVAEDPTDTLLYIRLAQVQIKAKRNGEAKLSLNNAYKLASASDNEEAQSYIKRMQADLN